MKIVLIIGVIACLALTSHAQIKYVHLSISQPNLEECITDIENNFKNCEIKIFPNPSDGVFTLEINNLSFGRQINLYVYDASGKEIIQEELKIIEGFKRTVDLSGYDKGTYIINIIGGPNAFFKAKLIIY